MSPQVSDEWRSDTKRKRRIHLFWPAAWYVGVALSVSAIAVFIAAYLVILFDLRGGWAWVVVVIALGSIGFAAGLPAALSWIVRRRRGPEGAESRPSKPGEPVKAGAWSQTIAPNREALEVSGDRPRSETRPRRSAARFQWLTLLAFMVVMVGLMLLFRSMWDPPASGCWSEALPRGKVGIPLVSPRPTPPVSLERRHHARTQHPAGA